MQKLIAAQLPLNVKVAADVFQHHGDAMMIMTVTMLLMKGIAVCLISFNVE